MYNNNINFDNFDAVIFDLDGTLIDSMWMWHDIDINYLAKFDIPFPDDLQSSINGLSFTETAIYFKKRFNIPDEIDTIKDDWNNMAYDIYTSKVTLKEGILDFLSYLKAHNKKIGIGTANSTELTHACLKSLDIIDYFDVIVTGCDVTKGKPNPDIYLSNSSKLNISPDRCLVFEDIMVGIMAAKNAGMQVCLVYDEHAKSDFDVNRQAADYYIYDYSNLNF